MAERRTRGRVQAVLRSFVLPAIVAMAAFGGARAAHAANACFINVNVGQAVGTGVNGSTVAGPGCPTPGTHNVGYAGTFNISIDGGASTLSYCVDLTHSISPGQCEPQITPTYPCEVVYILNHYYPAPGAPIVLPLAQEAAAVQAAIWHFTDCYVASSPSAIVSRANAIIADASANGASCTPPSVPQSVTIVPASSTLVLPTQTTFSGTVVVKDGQNLPVAGAPVTVSVAGVSGGTPNITGTTDANGQFAFAYPNTFQVAGSDSVTATVSYTVPVGLEFKTANVQGIVLAGTPRAGSVQGNAVVNWVHPSCGDGIVNQQAELCDDGNTVDGDGCDSNCLPTGCGNGIVTAGEECDDGNGISGDGCDANCTLPRCGNGVVVPPEQCDDGNQVNGDGCDVNCRPTGCGNGVVTAGEQCDDGNNLNGDSCEADCTTPRCGNGIVDAFLNEQCDDGNNVNGDGCNANCTLPSCGDGIVTPPEQCDDGNNVNGDGCDAGCVTSRCGNGIVAGSEQCDDGNNVNGDACEADCTLPRCGNGIVDQLLGEVCDDGNNLDGDGCSADCKSQEICNDLIDGDGDGLIDCDDPDCPPCAPFARDPAVIAFKPHMVGHDKLAVHGRIHVDQYPDFLHQAFGVLLTNANGTVYLGRLAAGEFLPAGGGGGARFQDKVALTGTSTHGGIVKVKVVTRRNFMVITFLASADLMRATLPTMGIQVLIGNQVAYYKSEWQKKPSGWSLKLPPPLSFPPTP